MNFVLGGHNSLVNNVRGDNIHQCKMSRGTFCEGTVFTMTTVSMFGHFFTENNGWGGGGGGGVLCSNDILCQILEFSVFTSIIKISEKLKPRESGIRCHHYYYTRSASGGL